MPLSISDRVLRTRYCSLDVDITAIIDKEQYISVGVLSSFTFTCSFIHKLALTFVFVMWTHLIVPTYYGRNFDM